MKQRYGTALRSCTLAPIKPEITQALQSLLDDIRATEDAKVMGPLSPPVADPHKLPSPPLASEHALNPVPSANRLDAGTYTST